MSVRPDLGDFVAIEALLAGLELPGPPEICNLDLVVEVQQHVPGGVVRVHYAGRSDVRLAIRTA